MTYNKHGRTPGESEFSWGPDLSPPGLQDASPADGGRYKGTAPTMGVVSDGVESAARLLVDGDQPWHD